MYEIIKLLCIERCRTFKTEKNIERCWRMIVLKECRDDKWRENAASHRWYFKNRLPPDGACNFGLKAIILMLFPGKTSNLASLVWLSKWLILLILAMVLAMYTGMNINAFDKINIFMYLRDIIREGKIYGKTITRNLWNVQSFDKKGK